MRGDDVSGWVGAILGVIGSVLLAWVLRSASLGFHNAGSRVDYAGASAHFVLLGVILGSLMHLSRWHPLTVLIPTLGFVVVFGPVLLPEALRGSWYPLPWIRSYLAPIDNPTPFVALGVLVVASITALRRNPWFGVSSGDGS